MLLFFILVKRIRLHKHVTCDVCWSWPWRRMCCMHEFSISSSSAEQFMEDPAKTGQLPKVLSCVCCLNFNLLFLYRYWSVWSVVKVNIVCGWRVRRRTAVKTELCMLADAYINGRWNLTLVCFYWSSSIWPTHIYLTSYFMHLNCPFLISVPQCLKTFW